jgi:hypothetical protein
VAGKLARKTVKSNIVLFISPHGEKVGEKIETVFNNKE